MNEWKRYGKKFFSWICVTALLAWTLCAGAAGADAAVLAKESCSLTVTITNKADEMTTPVAGIQVDICQVAGLDGSGGYRLTDSFSGAEISLAELTGGSEVENAEKAKEIYQYIKANGITYQTAYTDSSGNASFYQLEQGIYVVFGISGQAVGFSPYLAFLPLTVNGSTIYDVNSIPKTTDGQSGDLYKSIDVMKLWDDNNDSAGKRPVGVTITLYRDSIEYKSVVLNGENSWKHTFEQLPASGTYTVEETAVPGYTAAYSGSEEAGFVIINTYKTNPPGGGGSYIPDTGSISVKKVWVNESGESEERPDSITVQLIRNKSVYQTVTLNENNDWKHTFTGLSTSDSYTIKEITPANYTAAYSGNASSGYTITNAYTPGTTDPGNPPAPDTPPTPQTTEISVKKVWSDQEDAAGVRPEKITVKLIADSSVYQKVTLSSKNHWKAVFTDLPVNHTYTILEEAAANYTAVYSGSASEGYRIKNKYTKGTTDPGVPPDSTEPGSGQEHNRPDDYTEPDETDSKTYSSTPVKPIIPQTGFIVWPVYMLLGLGVLLIIWGSIDIVRDDSPKDA